MSAETARQFVDTTVLVYAFDPSAGPKKIAAEQLIARLWMDGVGCLSVQVLQEFSVTVTRKVRGPLSVLDASERVRELAAWRVFAGASDVLAAIGLQQHAKVGSWDALVSRRPRNPAARRSGART